MLIVGHHTRKTTVCWRPAHRVKLALGETMEPQHDALRRSHEQAKKWLRQNK